MVNVTCYNCGVVFGMTEQLHNERRQDHESFYCPNGHGQAYLGKTDEEKKIEELERAWQRTSRVLRGRDQENVTRAQYVDTIRPKLAEHLRDEHGARARLRAITEKASA